MTINVKTYGAVGDGIADDTIPIQNAINDAYTNGEKVYIPKGTYLITASLVMPFSSAVTLNQGNYIFGDGMMNSIIKISGSNITAIQYTQPSPLKFQLDGSISDLTIDCNGQANAVALQIHALYQHRFISLRIINGWRGIIIKNTVSPGDNDASNNLSFQNCRVENCSQWGIFSDLTSGNNENSYLKFENCFITGCGTVTGSVGGGMYWRGQMLQFDSCAFVANNVRGLYIEGGAGLGSNVLLNNTTFENNKLKGLECWGLTNLICNNLQIYNNNTFVAQYGVYLNAGGSLIANVRVNSCQIRATAGNNPYTAFYAAGANLSGATVILDSKQARWDNFGYAGQTQSSGWTLV